MSSPDSFTFTVGKLDAGMAILLGERAHLIEFPSILLPPGATTGSIVNISVHRNHDEEHKRDAEFWDLQKDILNEFGVDTPEAPQLKLRNVTQTSVTLEWPPIQLAKAKLRSLDIYRNGQRFAAIPSPATNTSTKLSALEIYSDYSFQLILRTTAGTFPSNIIRVRTHSMSDTSGISVCFGNVQDSVLLEKAKLALKEMKAKWSDKIQIDTTHFVCTTPAATPSGARATGNAGNSPGVEYQRALQLSIPVVQPHWILACHSEKKMVPIASFYLGATPSPTAPFHRHQSMSQASVVRSAASPVPSSPTNAHAHTSNRMSMPVTPSSRSPPAQTSPFVGQGGQNRETPGRSVPPPFAATPEDDSEDGGAEQVQLRASSSPGTGEMNLAFRFPRGTMPTSESSTSAGGALTAREKQLRLDQVVVTEEKVGPNVITPSSIEVPPPQPVEKERSAGAVSPGEEIEEEVGPTVDIPL